MKIIAEAYGVTSVAIEGPDKDRVVVLGDGVDSAELVKSLRKNVGNASITFSIRLRAKWTWLASSKLGCRTIQMKHI
ncbi:hypothetical protein WN943_002315 [Citrus x changshan-huyou]